MADDLHTQLKLASVAHVKALNLTGSDPGVQVGQNVLSQFLPDESQMIYPCVVCTTEGEREQALPGTTLHKDKIFPVRLFIADRVTGREHQREKDYLKWRKQMWDELHEVRPFRVKALVGEVYWSECDPQVIFDPRLPQYQMVVSGFVVKYYTRELRRDAYGPAF